MRGLESSESETGQWEKRNVMRAQKSSGSDMATGMTSGVSVIKMKTQITIESRLSIMTSQKKHLKRIKPLAAESRKNIKRHRYSPPGPVVDDEVPRANYEAESSSSEQSGEEFPSDDGVDTESDLGSEDDDFNWGKETKQGGSVQNVPIKPTLI